MANTWTYVTQTFPIVERKDEQKYGEYRIKRVIMEIYDAMLGRPAQPPTLPNEVYSASWGTAMSIFALASAAGGGPQVGFARLTHFSGRGSIVLYTRTIERYFVR